MSSAPVFPASPTLQRAKVLRERSQSSGLRRPFTFAESIVAALVAEGYSYPQAAKRYGSKVETVKFHAKSAAEKLIDATAVDAELARLRPYLRLYTWAHRVS